MRLDEFFSDVLDIKSEALVEKLCAAARVVKVKKGELLIREGERQGNTLFLMEGICRGYDILENGKETTEFFLYSARSADDDGTYAAWRCGGQSDGRDGRYLC